MLAAGSPESTRYHEALEALCRTYWFPLYAYLRRRGHDKHQAEDCIQGFFANLLEKRGLRLVDPKCGKFRSFMLVALKHFLADQRGRELGALPNTLAAGQYRTGDDRQTATQRIASSLPSARIVQRPQRRVQRAQSVEPEPCGHPFRRERFFERAEVGGQLGRTENIFRIGTQRANPDGFRRAVGAVELATVSAESPRRAHFRPAGSQIAHAAMMSWIHEGLKQQNRMTESLDPVGRQPPGHPCQNARCEGALMVVLARKNQKTAVLNHEVTPLCRLFGAPADPAVPIRQMIRAGAEAGQSDPLSPSLSDVLDPMPRNLRVAQRMTGGHCLVPLLLLFRQSLSFLLHPAQDDLPSIKNPV